MSRSLLLALTLLLLAAGFLIACATSRESFPSPTPISTAESLSQTIQEIDLPVAPAPDLPADAIPVAQASLLQANRIISYYGHPFSAVMGILGEGPMETIYERLNRQAEAFRIIDPDRGVKLAFHLIYAVAQASAGADGLFIYHTDDAIVRSFIDFTRERDMLLFLDLQNGRADVEEEVRRALPYLLESHVQLALDPEFTMSVNELPGVHIGQLQGETINKAQEILAEFVSQNNLPGKILIIHQFLDDMVLDREVITTFPGVDLIFDMDGFGGSATKVEKYHRYAVQAPGQYRAMKLFYRWDLDLMSPEGLLNLDPRPDIIIYQ